MYAASNVMMTPAAGLSGITARRPSYLLLHSFAHAACLLGAHAGAGDHEFLVRVSHLEIYNEEVGACI